MQLVAMRLAEHQQRKDRMSIPSRSLPIEDLAHLQSIAGGLQESANPILSYAATTCGVGNQVHRCSYVVAGELKLHTM